MTAHPGARKSPIAATSTPRRPKPTAFAPPSA